MDNNIWATFASVFLFSGLGDAFARCGGASLQNIHKKQLRPAMLLVQSWTPQEFKFDVKLPKLLSRHAMQAKFLPADVRSKLQQR